ncbi:hypothetical protein ACF065_18435 [Streptomyces sp. NPDC015232]|uniref:hypothetical protein n=1 Tax=unclassified Streptomyces TaxID=2593676 RepID=UPI003701BDAD
MRTSFKIHAGLQFALSLTGLLAGTLATVPHRPPFTDEWVALGIGIALLVPLHLLTIVRSCAIALRTDGQTTKAHQWQAFRALPLPARLLLVGAGLAGVALFAGTGKAPSHLVNPGSADGRYFAVDTADPRRQRTEIPRSTYEALRKDEQTSLFAGYALLAAGGGGMTLVFAKLDSWAGAR